MGHVQPKTRWQGQIIEILVIALVANFNPTIIELCQNVDFYELYAPFEYDSCGVKS